MPNIAATLLREARNRRALSQRALAAEADTAQSVIARIESGSSSPGLDTLAGIVGAAGFDLKIELVPRPHRDPVVEAYKAGIDRTLLIANLSRSVDERLVMNADVQYFTDELRRSLRVAEAPPS